MNAQSSFTAAGSGPAAVLVDRPALPFSPEAPWLAPLAGWSDLAFRLLCRELGAAVCCTEMVSAKGLLHGNHATRELLRATVEDSPLVVQLFGSDPGELAAAAALVLELGATHVDLNMGCSVPKVVKTGAGAALLREPERAVRAGRAIAQVAGPGRAGVKLRLGWSAGQENWREIVRGLVEAGVAWLTLHPRFGAEGFSGRARWGRLAELKALVAVPVVASGDLLTAADAVACLEQTGADAVMFGRGALSNPAIFADFASLRQTGGPRSLCPAEVAARVRRHLALSLEHHGERVTVMKMRTFIPRTIRHLPGSRSLRESLVRCRRLDEARGLLDAFFARSPGAEEV